MRILWTLFKIIVALAVAIPLGIFIMTTALGAFGVLLGLTRLALRVACLGFVGYGVYRLARFFFAPASKPQARLVREITSRDSYYEAAMRELDSELGSAPTR